MMNRGAAVDGCATEDDVLPTASGRADTCHKTAVWAVRYKHTPTVLDEQTKTQTKKCWAMTVQLIPIGRPMVRYPWTLPRLDWARRGRGREAVTVALAVAVAVAVVGLVEADGEGGGQREESAARETRLEDFSRGRIFGWGAQTRSNTSEQPVDHMQATRARAILRLQQADAERRSLQPPAIQGCLPVRPATRFIFLGLAGGATNRREQGTPYILHNTFHVYMAQVALDIHRVPLG